MITGYKDIYFWFINGFIYFRIILCMSLLPIHFVYLLLLLIQYMDAIKNIKSPSYYLSTKELKTTLVILLFALDRIYVV